MKEDIVLEVNPNKTNSLRELGSINMVLLKEKVLALPAEAWDTEEDFTANYNKDKALSQTRHIVFRFAEKRETITRYYNTSRWESWKALLIPVMEQATRAYSYVKGYYPKVMLANVPPGCIIPTHIDGGHRGSAPHKIHIVLQTNPQAFFYVVPEKYHLAEGHAYEVNNAGPHGVINQGICDRIHLVFEYLDLDLQPEVLKKSMLAVL